MQERNRLKQTPFSLVGIKLNIFFIFQAWKGRKNSSLKQRTKEELIYFDYIL